MKVGDLVKKRWGKIEPHQVGTVAIVTGKHVDPLGPNPAFHGYWLMVLYPDRPIRRERPGEFEVISESR
jgi:hypothetical protein